MPLVKQGRGYLVVRVGATLCGLPLDRIKRVVRALPVHGVPGSSPVLLGLSQLDGEPIGVLDLGRLLDLGATGTTEHMVTIVTHVGPSDRTETVGLAADEALQIAGFEVEDEAGLGQCTVYGERELDGRVIRLVDLARLGNGDR